MKTFSNTENVLYLGTNCHKKSNIFYRDKFVTDKIAADWKTDQRHIQDNIKHLGWGFLQNLFMALLFLAKSSFLDVRLRSE